MFGKNEYHSNMEEQLRHLGAKIDELVSKGGKATAEAKAEYTRQADILRAKEGEARKKLKELSVASDAAWHGLRDGLDKSWQELKSAWDHAVSKFK